MRCIRCGLPGAGPEPWRKLCWTCFRDVNYAGIGNNPRDRSAVNFGTNNKQALDDTRLRQLIQLCHPDKHNNSELSQVVTKWLLEMRR